MSQARFAVAIVASDQTAKGVKSAEKRLGGIGKDANRFGKDLRQIASGSALGSVNRVVKSFGSIEKASARAFGVGSVTARISGRLGGIGQAASAAASGLGEASASAGILGGALGAVGIAGVATVAVLVAAGAATYKLVSSWSDAGASLGRLSQMLGIATKDLQEFQGAGQRYGIDKDSMSGAVGGIAKTIHDARYGRNNEALAIMGRLGVRFKYGKDGQLDYTAMTLDLSDAIARQKDAQTRSMIAEKFGGAAALPLLSKGSATIRSEMADYAKTGPEMSDKDVVAATGVQRQGVIAKQMLERVTMKAGGWLGENVAAPVMSAVVDGGRNISGGAEKFSKGVDRFVSAVGGAVRKGLDSVIPAAQASERKWGIPASVQLGQYGLESSWGKRMPKGSNNPFGIKARAGEPFVVARTREVDKAGRSYYINEKFRKFASIEEAFDAHGRLLATAKVYAKARAHLDDPDAFADALTGTYATDPNYGRSLKSVMHKNGLMDLNNGQAPIKSGDNRIVLEIHGLPSGTKVKAKGNALTAVGYAMPNFGHGL